MIGKYANNSYKHLHKKSVKSFETYLTRNSVSGKLRNFATSQLRNKKRVAVLVAAALFTPAVLAFTVCSNASGRNLG